MSTPQVDRRNGYGFYYNNGHDVNIQPDMSLFPEVADTVLKTALEIGNCLVTGGPGSGKSHLIEDVLRTAEAEARPALGIAAHISGGSKKGVDNALFVLGSFAEKHGRDGVVAVDNVDYYGYSGSSAGRRYSLAKSHIDVAREIQRMVTEDQAPVVVGTAHTEDWRKTHWRFADKRADDEVTPAADQLFNAFDHEFKFEGQISEEVARQLLRQKGIEPAAFEDVLEAIRIHSGSLNFRYVNHLPDQFDPSEIVHHLGLINQRTAHLLGGLSCA